MELIKSNVRWSVADDAKVAINLENVLRKSGRWLII
jgi:hypothetical protein